MTSRMPSISKDIVERINLVVGNAPRPVPLHAPEFNGSEWEKVKDCLDTGWVSSVGRYVDEFEYKVAESCGTKFGVALVNGTAALQMALQVVGVKPGDEVLVPSLSFVATANAVVHLGAKPHFIDIDPDTLGLSPTALEEHLRQNCRAQNSALINKATGARISAVVPMHVFGHPASMRKIWQVAEEFGLHIVEDAAEALGSEYFGSPCGSLGHVAALSFNGNKTLTTGGGGAIVTNDATLATRAKHLSTTAKLPHQWEFVHDEVGYNFRMPNLNAALGCAQLEQLPERLLQKRALADKYFEAFKDLEDIEMFQEPANCKSNFWLNTLVLKTPDLEVRDDILRATNAAGLQCRPVWRALHTLEFFKSNPRSKLPATESFEKRLINVPSSAWLGAA